MGLRAGEALRMKAEHYVAEGKGITMKIHGKRTRSDKTGIRFFPVLDALGSEAIPGLDKLLLRLIEESGRQGWLFPWRTGQHLQGRLRECRQATGTRLSSTGKSRSSKVLRDSANVLWRDEYKWSEAYWAALVGHDVKVNTKHYSTTRVPEVMMELAADAGSQYPVREKPTKVVRESAVMMKTKKVEAEEV